MDADYKMIHISPAPLKGRGGDYWVERNETTTGPPGKVISKKLQMGDSPTSWEKRPCGGKKKRRMPQVLGKKSVSIPGGKTLGNE